MSTNKEYFPGIERIFYQGPDSNDHLAFRYYDENFVVGGKTMKEQFRFAMAYWHSFCNAGSDPFGSGTRHFTWNVSNDPMENAFAKLDAAFEFMSKMGIPFYCFHDRDLAPEGATVQESADNLKALVDRAGEKQSETGIRLLWGTANLFSHPRYMNGAATNPDFNVLPHAASQVKAALDATVQLGGDNYVFWGGREGYSFLMNTDMKKELDHMGRFLQMARDYGRKIGFEGTFLIEPKPMEPSLHQYDFDAATVIGFLHQYGLENDFKLNIEANHATLANHSFAHELRVASDANLLGSIDANHGEPLNGWDTDNFPTNLYEATEAMLVVLESGGIGNGGFNFDAKTRRNSTDPEDIFIAHIAGMDTFARALLIADKLLNEKRIMDFRNNRYQSFNTGNGLAFENGDLNLNELAALAHQYGEPELQSGKQELIESIINSCI
ncbi:MAG: xylose isomerase [Bacteroidetes bacterium]|jgi:xylose isomerase|nr:xylose isomerase [Bacteroidota bacterium]MBT4409250.1 xylose isomerase [Bacteroidota bacterium]MBT5269314.1 xylose isomerase [Candidatus Neomarinimicrobiota bacterium]MBT7092730.1 xylose isomerase [Bacteroidota bacterium]